MAGDRRFTVVEQAGYVGERDITSFPTLSEALAHIDSHYDADERDQFHKDCLHVDVRQDWTDDSGEERSEYVY